MFKRSKVCTGVLVALGGALLAAPVWAQGERVEITGSRIKTIGAVSNSPITSVTAEEFNVSKPVAVEEIVRNLSASYPGIGPGTNNGSNGTASVDLRGLGTNRTLVLLNGRRIVPATLGGVVDTNAIPISLIERIDLVTGGASAVYGADAVSGVVNFVMKRDFSGIEASTSYGASEKGDSKRYSNSLTLGSNLADGRGNVVMNVTTSRTDPLTQGERDFGFFQINSATGNRDGSPAAVPATHAAIPGRPGNQVYDPAIPGLRAGTAADNYNFNPPNYYITPIDRTQVTALGRFTINDNAEAYAEVLHTRGKVVLNLAPSGTFFPTFPGSNGLYQIPIGNPFIPEPMRQQLCTAYNIAPADCVPGNTTEVGFRPQRRFTELGPRINDFDSNATQYTVGLRGSLPFFSEWSYDGYLQTGRLTQVSNRINWGSFTKVQQALRAVNTTTCINNTLGCVPLNVFGPEGSITPAMLNFINLSAVQTTQVEQKVANVSVSGDLGALKSPLAREPIALAIGVEQRKVNAGNASDGPSQTQGEVLGAGAPLPDRRGSLQLNEGFVEAIVPIASGMTGIHSLTFEGGYRQTEFKTEVSGKNYGSWKYGLTFAPVRDVRLRAMVQRATRAPNINELYAPRVTGLSNLAADPCQTDRINVADATTPGTLSYLCVQTGVPLSQVGFLAPPAAGQVNATSGGNLNLGPEEADTTTIGVVIEPSAVPGLAVTIDYFKIDVQKAISNPTTLQVMNGCYTAALNPGFSPGAALCGNVRRGVDGSLNGAEGIVTASSNLGQFYVEGFDIDVRYRLNLAAMGRVDLGLTVSQLDKWRFKSLPTVDWIDCAGYYGLNCGNPYFKSKFVQRTTWNLGNFSVGYVWRHLDKIVVEPSTASTFRPEFRSIKAYDYVDLSGTWDVTKNLRLSLSVNNAFDKQPPMVGNTIGGTGPNSGNTFPQTYDVVGRAYALQARLQF